MPRYLRFSCSACCLCKLMSALIPLGNHTAPAQLRRSLSSSDHHRLFWENKCSQQQYGNNTLFLQAPAYKLVRATT